MRRLLLTLTAFFLLTTPVNAAWVWPVSGDVITPYRNGTDPYASGQHRGIDIAAPVGTAVRAAAAGEVRFAGVAGSSGLTIGIRTADGYDTSYLHLSSLAVRAGTQVSAGVRIGAVGTTGIRSATAPHLHFGVRDAGTRYAYRDPLTMLPPPLAPAPAPNPPAAVPAPAHEPLAPRAAPVPITAPRTAPAPLSRPAPRGLPGRAPRDLPGRAPRSAPRPQLAPVDAPAPLPAPRTSARPLSTPLATDAVHGAPARPPHAPRARHPATSSQGAGLRGPSSSRHPLAVAQPAAAARRPAAGDGAHHRPDLGWALACAGLLLAAGVLGLTGPRGRRRSRAQARLAGALRPLVGRR